MFLAADDIGGADSGGRGPFDDFWYGPLPATTAAGVRVNDDTALRLAVLYACVNVISQDLAKVPLVLYRRHDDGSRERVTDHPVVKLLRNPFGKMTPMGWRERLQAHQLLRGNAYCEKRYDRRGQWSELKPFKPDNVRVELLAGGVRYHIRDGQSGAEKIYLEDEILHFTGLSLDGPLGLSPIDQARETLGESLAAQSYGATFFGNDARPSIVIQRKDGFKDNSQRDEWIRRFKRMFGGRNRFAPMLLEYGMEVKDVPALAHTDMQFIELRKFKANEICAIFRVPPHKVAILERSTNNNIEHQGIEYVTDCLLTWCRRWEERLMELLDESEREELYFEFTLDALMRGDQKTRFESYNSAITSGWLTRNEVRGKENLDHLDGLDEPLEPLNMVPAGSQPGAEVPDEPAPNKDEPEDDAQQDARGRELELQARRRVLNRETKALEREWDRAAGATSIFSEAVTSFYAWHLPFVAQALVVSRDVAEAYCMAQCSEIERAIAAAAVPALFASWEADAAALQFSPLPAAQPQKE